MVATASFAISSDDVPMEQISITPQMLSNADAATGLFDEQGMGANPTMFAPKTQWTPASKAPVSFVIDLGEEAHLGKIMFWDLNGNGDVVVSSGAEGNWTELLVEDGVGFKKWKIHEGLDANTRYLKVDKMTDGAAYGEMLVYAYTPEGSAMVAEAKAEAERRDAIIASALAEAKDRPLVDTGTLFGELPLVDEVNPGLETTHSFVDFPAGVSQVENVLGKPVRVLPNEGEDVKYFAYQMAENKYLEPGKPYLLTVEFPDNAPRSFHVANRGGDMTRGIQTGKALGDVIFTYTSTNLEPLDIPLSNKFMTFQQLFWLNDGYDGIEQSRNPKERIFSPVSGFRVIVGQPGAEQAPLSKGAAVARIRLFEVPDVERFFVPLNLPEGLPSRHLFYREEMADAVINSANESERSVTNPTDWYEYHMRLMRFLGMNTFSKDLLEFGHAQHWDVENPSWYNSHKFPHVWGEVVDLVQQYGLTLLPYYEYAGSTGRQGRGQRGKGDQLVMPLDGDDFTHVGFAEKNRVDLTDPETLAEFKHIIDLTILKYKDRAEFVGLWLRPRVAQMPMSFSDKTLARFCEETGRAKMTRKELKDDKATLDAYYEWWFGKRKEFLFAIYDYLKVNGVGEDGDPELLFMAVPKEPVPDIFVRGNHRIVVTDDTELWKDISTRREDYENFYVIDENDVPAQHLYLDAITRPLKTWGSWEWHHAAPQADPQNYKDTEGILMVYPYNRKYTVTDPTAMDAFRNDTGLAMVRHFPLNENTMDYVTGYFVTDFERVGTYQMMPEALAVANGDPWYLGYTSGHVFNRGFPSYARRFNANFLALPALPSRVVEGAASHENVVVREIKTDGKGTYLAIVNTGVEPLKSVQVKVPGNGRVTAAATGRVVSEGGKSVTLDLDAYELQSLHIQ